MRRSLMAAIAAVVVGAVAVPTGLAAGPRNQSVKKFGRVNLPYSTPLDIPKGTTVVTAWAKGGGLLSVELLNAQSNRSRCKSPTYISWTKTATGTNACSALTAIDPPGTQWKLTVNGDGGQAEVWVTFDRGPIPGPASKLDLSHLSMPRYDSTDTEDLMVPSFDGTELHVQVTRPVTKGKVPAVLVSSPYYAGGVSDRPYVMDWVPRGYAVVTADVRGYNLSGGCVEVWGPNEQEDQAFLVEWIAKQPWSNGRVGMYGKSYVGTTPIEAAVQAPEHLDAIVVEAPVVSAYEDWHFGGVPNGENAASPASYQAAYGATPTPASDPVLALQNSANGLCDPTLAARASDPRGIYDEFYRERDFAARAGDVKAAVLYIHGYEDSNVKATVYRNFFNNLKPPHLGIFGHFDHIWSPRLDAETLHLAWLDQYVKDKPIGLERLPNALVLNDAGGEHHLEGWPTKTAKTVTMRPDFAGGTLQDAAADGNAQILLDSTGMASANVPTRVVLSRTLKAPLELAGIASLRLSAALAGAENAYVSAWLYDVKGSDRSLVTFGMANLAHRNGHDQYAPVLPTDTVEMPLDFVITDHVFEAGHEIELEIRAAEVLDWTAVQPSEPGLLTLYGGPDGIQFLIPTLPVGSASKAEAGPAPVWS